MTRFPDVFGATEKFRDDIFRNGFLDIQTIKPEDVVDAEPDRQWLPDFKQVFAIINIAHSQSDYNSILLMANQRLVKCRLSPNALISRLKQQFLLDPKLDVAYMANSMGIMKSVPYVCGDFLLAPVGKQAATNNSWIRLYTPDEIWEHDEKHTLINYPTIGVLRIPHDKRSMETRDEICRRILGSFQKYALSILPTIDLSDKHPSDQELLRIRKRLEDFLKDFWSRKFTE